MKQIEWHSPGVGRDVLYCSQHVLQMRRNGKWDSNRPGLAVRRSHSPASFRYPDCGFRICREGEIR